MKVNFNKENLEIAKKEFESALRDLHISLGVIYPKQTIAIELYNNVIYVFEMIDYIGGNSILGRIAQGNYKKFRVDKIVEIKLI